MRARALPAVLVGTVLLALLVSCGSMASSATKVTEIARYGNSPTQLTVTVEPTEYTEPDTLYLVVVYRGGEVRAKLQVAWTGAELDAGRALYCQMAAKPYEIASYKLEAGEGKSRDLLGYFTVGSPSLVTLGTWWMILLIALATIVVTLIVWGVIHKELARAGSEGGS